MSLYFAGFDTRFLENSPNNYGNGTLRVGITLIHYPFMRREDQTLSLGFMSGKLQTGQRREEQKANKQKTRDYTKGSKREREIEGIFVCFLVLFVELFSP